MAMDYVTIGIIGLAFPVIGGLIYWYNSRRGGGSTMTGELKKNKDGTIKTNEKKTTKKYPVEVVYFSRYANTLRPKFDVGRFQPNKDQTEHGVIENNRFFIAGLQKEIPEIPQKFYNDIENKRIIYFYQIDRHTFCPMSFDGHKVTIYYQTPIMDEVLDETSGDYVQVPAVDEDGKTIMETTERVIFDGTIVIGADNVVKEVEGLLAHQTYDKDYFQSDEIEKSNRMYEKKGNWEKYYPFIMLVGAGFIMVMFFWLGAKQYAELSQIYADGLIKSAQIFADATRPAVVPTPPL